MIPYSGSPSALVDLSHNLAETLAQASRAVVTLYARSRFPSSGILWRPGIVVTASHTVERQEQLYITLPEGETVEVTLAGRDPTTDIALLQLPDSDTRFDPLPHADPKHLMVGHLVLALGRSGETGVGASLGMISALGDSWRTRRGGQIDRWIRPDLTLYRGFVGGPLLDALGQVVGMNTPMLSRRSDLTIPASTLDRVVDQLLERGRVARGYLGVGMQPVQLTPALAQNLDLSQTTGVMIVSLESEGPAERSGALLGDILIQFDGVPVQETFDVLELLTQERIDTTVPVQILRAGQLRELQIQIAERPQRE